MNNGFLSFLSGAVITFLAMPTSARADANPDFDDDAKPILRVQPHLIQEVESRYEVKDSGIAKYPGDDDHRALPPYIFEARPRGSNGPFNLRLLIQPGPPGRILRVVDMAKVHPPVPPGSSAPPQPASVITPSQQAPPQPSAPQPAPPQPTAPPQPAEPTSDTPSGPIRDPGDQAAPSSPPSSTAPSLEPPPDPAPASH